MPLSKDVEKAVEGLIELGVLNEAGLIRLAGLFEGIKAISGSFRGRENSTSPSGSQGFFAKEVPSSDDAAYTPRASFHEPHDGDTESADDEREHDEERSGFGSDVPLASAPGSGFKRRTRAPNGSFSPTKAELRDLRESGMTVRQIAELRGVSTATVNKKLREFGLTDPARGSRSQM